MICDGATEFKSLRNSESRQAVYNRLEGLIIGNSEIERAK